MARKAFVEYDSENDIIHFYTAERVKDSLGFDQFVFDFSHEDKIVGLEVMGVSKLLKKLGVAIPKSALAEIREAFLINIPQREFVYVKVLFVIRHHGKKVQKEILVPAPIPQAARIR